jgi:hypothetical protein
MKKLVIFLILVTIVCTLFGCGAVHAPTQNNSTTYKLSNCVVYDVGRYPGEVAIADKNMDIWVWHDDLDKCIGDKCTLTMNNNNTPEYLYDDIIVHIDWE